MRELKNTMEFTFENAPAVVTFTNSIGMILISEDAEYRAMLVSKIRRLTKQVLIFDNYMTYLRLMGFVEKMASYNNVLKRVLYSAKFHRFWHYALRNRKEYKRFMKEDVVII